MAEQDTEQSININLDKKPRKKRCVTRKKKKKKKYKYRARVGRPKKRGPKPKRKNKTKRRRKKRYVLKMKRRVGRPSKISLFEPEVLFKDVIKKGATWYQPEFKQTKWRTTQFLYRRLKKLFARKTILSKKNWDRLLRVSILIIIRELVKKRRIMVGGYFTLFLGLRPAIPNTPEVLEEKIARAVKMLMDAQKEKSTLTPEQVTARVEHIRNAFTNPQMSLRVRVKLTPKMKKFIRKLLEKQNQQIAQESGIGENNDKKEERRN